MEKRLEIGAKLMLEGGFPAWEALGSHLARHWAGAGVSEMPSAALNQWLYFPSPPLPLAAGEPHAHSPWCSRRWAEHGPDQGS